MQVMYWAERETRQEQQNRPKVLSLRSFAFPFLEKDAPEKEEKGRYGHQF